MDSHRPGSAGYRPPVGRVLKSACGPSEAPEGSPAKPGRRVRASGGGAPRAVKDIVGVVTETLPSAMYRIRLDGGGRQVLAHIADRIDRNFIRVLVGDRVRVELSPVDLGRGRIVEKVG
jgi:translation initiation factor IF-1